ncbi:MAG: hypothetical protein ACK4J0_02890 [Candidatus Anstonellaceae archaeon]
MELKDKKKENFFNLKFFIFLFLIVILIGFFIVSGFLFFLLQGFSSATNSDKNIQPLEDLEEESQEPVILNDISQLNALTVVDACNSSKPIILSQTTLFNYSTKQYNISYHLEIKQSENECKAILRLDSFTPIGEGNEDDFSKSLKGKEARCLVNKETLNTLLQNNIDVSSACTNIELNQINCIVNDQKIVLAEKCSGSIFDPLSLASLLLALNQK